MRFLIRAFFAVIALVSALGFSIGTSNVALADRSVSWQSFDVNLTLIDDGSYHVAERQVIDFLGGPFSFGFATIPLKNLEGLDNIVIREETASGVETFEYVSPSQYDDEEGTFTVERTSTEVTVSYGFGPTTDQTRTIVLEYDVFGALRVYPDPLNPGSSVEQIWWTAIAEDVTAIGPIESSTVTVTLPQAVNPNSVVIGQDGEEVALGADLLAATPGAEASTDVEKFTSDGQIFTWTKDDMSSGDGFEVRLQFPAVTGATAPSWQIADDERRQAQEEQEERSALLNIFFLAFGLLAGAGGGIGIYGLWYTRGRDPHTGLVAEFIPNPPDDLPPGAAGTLLDETADQQDIVATLVDLGHRGVLKIDEIENDSFLGFGGGRDFQLTLQNMEGQLVGFERELINALFTEQKDGASVKLGEVKARFDSAQKEIKEELYKELVQRGYFLSSPEGVRRNWRRIGVIVLVGVFLLSCVFGRVAGEAVLYWLPVVVLAALGGTILLISKVMPKKTQAGAEAAAKWRAFRQYLDDIGYYENLEESKDIFDKYLPYAVAFGLEQSWVNKFASVNTPAPEWYGTPFPGGAGGRRRGPVIIMPGTFGGGTSRGGGGGPDVNLPNMQDLSDSASGGLQGMSNSLSDMFDIAGQIFGGMGGGGRGGFGGGGSSFGGGGFGGGSSGGGSRGFG